jgi:hypothetical protein
VNTAIGLSIAALVLALVAAALGATALRSRRQAPSLPR